VVIFELLCDAARGRFPPEDGVTEVVGVARRRPSWQPDKTHWVEADVVLDDLVPIFRGADAVIHLAWLRASGGASCEQESVLSGPRSRPDDGSAGSRATSGWPEV